MRIVILGAGQVGTSVAQSLVSESNDITVVDSDEKRLAYLQERLDLRTVCGNGVLPSVLGNAGLDDADIFLAVSQSDATNLVACKLAASVFNVPTRIARLRSPEYLAAGAPLADAEFGVNYALCPEKVITDYLVKLVDFPEALQVLTFADGRVVLVGMRAEAGGRLVGQPIKTLPAHLGEGSDARIAAIFRRGRSIPPTGDTVIEEGDEVFVLAAEEHIRQVILELGRQKQPVRRVVVAGAGNIGLRVAKQLSARVQVKLIESNAARAYAVSGDAGDALVLHGDATDDELLNQEGIEETDLFLALTNDDEDNIMAASLAKNLGCGRVLALINRRAYADLVQGGPIDIAISPAQVSIGDLLTHVRRGFVVKVHSLRRGVAEALEIVVHGDERTSSVVGRRVGELKPIPGATLAVIVREAALDDMPASLSDYNDLPPRARVIIAHKSEVILSGDHVIVFCVNKKVVRRVEKLFQVGVGFF